MQRRGMVDSEDQPKRKVDPSPAPQPQIRPKATVTGIFEIRCSICRLGKLHPDVVELLHRAHFEEGQSYDQIMQRVSVLAQQRGFKPIKRSAFTAHFNTHVPADQAFLHAEVAAQAKAQANKPPADPDIMNQVLGYKREGLAKMHENIERWQRVLDEAFRRIDIDNTEASSPDDQKRKLHANIGAMSTATAAVTALTSAIDRFVNSKDFILNVIDEGIDLFARQLAMALGEAKIDMEPEFAKRAIKDPEEAAHWLFTSLGAALTAKVHALRSETQEALIEQFSLNRRTG